MARKCDVENCDNPVFGGGKCTSHQWMRPQKKKKFSPIKKTVKKALGKTKAKRKTVRLDFHTDDLKAMSISQLKRTADYWFRQALLAVAERNSSGYILCPLTNVWLPESALDVAHFIDRTKQILRYDTDNCCLCSSTSNQWDAQKRVAGFRSVHHRDYEEYLGEEKVKDLKKRSQEKIVRSKDDLVELINKQKQIIDDNR